MCLGCQLANTGSLFLCDNYRLSLPVRSLGVLTSVTQPTTHIFGGVVMGSDERYLPDTIRALYITRRN
jgi:hypothetical protein